MNRFSRCFKVSEVLEAWLAVQRNWLYLQPIFESPDINKQVHGAACRCLVSRDRVSTTRQ